MRSSKDWATSDLLANVRDALKAANVFWGTAQQCMPVPRSVTQLALAEARP